MTGITADDFQGKIPVKRLLPGDKVRATQSGPLGTVTSIDHGWTVVKYPAGDAFYRHGEDRVYLIEAVRP